MDKLKLFIELPLGIQLKMLEFQVASGNTMNPHVFEKDIRSNTKLGGFEWNSFVSNAFWLEVLQGNYDIFFERFPDSEYPKFAYAKISGYYRLCLIYKNSNLANNLKYPFIVNPKIRNLDSYLENKNKAYTIHYMSKIFTEKELVENGELTIKTLSPKEKTFPRVMLVRQQSIDKWEKRVVIAYKCKHYISWTDAETLEDAENKTSTITWMYAKEIDEEFIVTKEEISNKFNIPIENLIIK